MGVRRALTVECDAVRADAQEPNPPRRAWQVRLGWRVGLRLACAGMCDGPRRGLAVCVQLNGNGPEWHRLYHERLLVPCGALNSIFAVIGIGSATESLHTPSDRVAT